AADPAGRIGGTQLRDPGRTPLAAPAGRRGAGADRRGGRGNRPGAGCGPGAGGRLFAAQDEDHPPRVGRVDRHVTVEVAVAGRDGEAAGQPDGRGQLGRGPEAVRHDVGDGPHRAAALVVGDADVFPGDLRDRVDLILRAP